MPLAAAPTSTISETGACCPAPVHNAQGGGFWAKLFDTADFPPRWRCGNWDTALGVLHITADIAIWLCYVAIPVALIYFMRRRSDLPFKGIFLLFGAFIISCGTTHLLEAIMFYQPMYRLLGLVKLITAVVSFATVVALIPIIPKALSLRTAEELAEQVAERTRAEEANAAKSQFLATMSHEIRTPLTAILGFAENLRDESLPSTTRRANTETIVRNGKHLLDVLNDILDLSKIEAGRMAVFAKRESPWGGILELCGQFSERASAKNVAFEWAFDTPVPEIVTTDSLRLRQILFNLLGNALKFTEAGCIRLGISFSERDGESGVLRFDISDTGIGISPGAASQLFNSFTQADATTTRKFGGTGLGLVISRRLAQILGGDVELVRSELRKGSTFRCTIAVGPREGAPLLSPEEVIRQVAQHAVVRVDSEAGISLKGVRILLVEDSPDNQRLICHILRTAGAEIGVAENGQVGVSECQFAVDMRRPFDVILMDMQMPLMDGYEATRRIRAAGFEGPIIALTANTMSGDRERCIAAGCDDFAPKPINRAGLLATIRRYADLGICQAQST